MKDLLNRPLLLGDLVLTEFNSYYHSFGLIVGENEVFGFYKDNYKIFKPLQVFLLDKDDINFKTTYERLLNDYNEYTLKFSIKSSNDIRNIRVGDVFESNKKKGRYAVYLGNIELEYLDSRFYNDFKKLTSRNFYVILPDKFMKNNGFMKSMFNEYLELNLGSFLSIYTKCKFDDFRIHGLLFQNKLSKEYVAKVGHVNFIKNDDVFYFSDGDFKKRWFV